jgi:hypothetical protein
MPPDGRRPWGPVRGLFGALLGFVVEALLIGFAAAAAAGVAALALWVL